MRIETLEQATVDIEGTMMFIAVVYFFAKKHWIAAGICTAVFIFALYCVGRS